MIKDGKTKKKGNGSIPRLDGARQKFAISRRAIHEVTQLRAEFQKKKKRGIGCPTNKTRFLNLAEAIEDLYHAQNALESLCTDPDTATLRTQCPALSKLFENLNFAAGFNVAAGNHPATATHKNNMQPHVTTRCKTYQKNTPKQ